MSKEKSERERVEPKVPEVSAATWKALLKMAEDFNRLAPWKWMHDSQVVGLRHPHTKEVFFGSILGRLGQMFAVMIYRNEAGRRWLLNTILTDGNTGDENDGFEQDLIKVEFVAKRELTKPDRAALAAREFAPSVKGPRAWPQFRNMVPGGYPWHVTQEEAEILLWAVPRVKAVAQLVKSLPRLWDNHCDGEIAFVAEDFDPAAEELRAEQIDWEPMLPPPEPRREKVSLDEKTIADLLKFRQAKGFDLEMDVFYSWIVIADVDRPRFPWAALAVDRKSGFVGGFHLSETSDRDGAAALAHVLQKHLTEFSVRPERILVQSQRVGGMLEKIAARLEIPVKLVAKLESLNLARASFEQHFARR